MIFQAEMAKKIAAGLKTQTRRPVKPGETTCRYKTGRVYTVQAGRGKPGRDQITITDVHQERLGDITLQDAKREGFRTTNDFKTYWAALYGWYDSDKQVFVVSFVRGNHTDQPKLLAARCGGPHGDYTTQPALAMKGEGESPPSTILDGYAKENQAIHQATVQELQARALTAIQAIRPHANARQDKRLRAAANQIRSLIA